MTTLVENAAAAIVIVSFLNLGRDLTHLIASNVDLDSRFAFALTCTIARDAMFKVLEEEDGQLTTVVSTVLEKTMSVIDWGYVCYEGYFGHFERSIFEYAFSNDTLYQLLERLNANGCFFGEKLVVFIIEYYNNSLEIEVLECLYNFRYEFGKETIIAVLKIGDNAINVLQWLFDDECSYDNDVFYEAFKIFAFNNYQSDLTDYSDSDGSCFKLIIDTFGIPYNLDITKIESIVNKHYREMFRCDCGNDCDCDTERMVDDRDKAVKKTVEFFTKMWHNYYYCN
jgi:hypothetical protein